MSRALLEARELAISVPGRELIESLDFTLHGGEFLALLGTNGAGKSLLLRTLAGLRPIARGQVLLEGTPIGAMPRRAIATRLGFLPQDPEAAPQGALADGVLLGRFAHLGFWEAAGTADEARVLQALRTVGLGQLGARELATLSGGEQRRAAIARLLVQDPVVYLLDEPTNHLDPAQQLGVLDRMRDLARDGAAVIASLHDPNLALRYAHRVCLLDGAGGAEIVACPELAPRHLSRLYGLRFSEARLGEQRFMAPS